VLEIRVDFLEIPYMTKNHNGGQKVKSYVENTETKPVFSNGMEAEKYVDFSHMKSTHSAFNSIFEVKYPTKSLTLILPPKGIQYLTICAIFDEKKAQIIKLDQPLISFFIKLVEGANQFDYTFSIAKPDILVINLKNEEIRLVVNDNSSYIMTPGKALQDIP
jgi:hypothetical protein